MVLIAFRRSAVAGGKGGLRHVVGPSVSDIGS